MRKTIFVSLFVVATACLALLPLLNSPAAQAQELQGGPTQLLITYRCPPPRRAAFRQYMTEQGIQRFEHWKKDGILKDYRFLFNWYVDVDNWDAMAVLSFPSYTQVAQWKEIERTSPGGLFRDALDMAWPLNTYSADLLQQGTGEAPADGRGVYYSMSYDFGSAAEFRDYANSVLAPQAKGWIKEGIVTSYWMFANRYPGGKRWQGLMLVEYSGMDAMARRDEVNTKVRTQLRSDAAFKAASDKWKVVNEREPVMADVILAR